MLSSKIVNKTMSFRSIYIGSTMLILYKWSGMTYYKRRKFVRWHKKLVHTQWKEQWCDILHTATLLILYLFRLAQYHNNGQKSWHAPKYAKCLDILGNHTMILLHFWSVGTIVFQIIVIIKEILWTERHDWRLTLYMEVPMKVISV